MKNNNAQSDQEKEPPTTEELDQMIMNLTARTTQIKHKKKQQRTGVLIVLLLLFSVGGFTGYEWLTKPDVYWAEHSPLEIILKDGSAVKLLQGAKLTVEKSFPADTRDVYLEGDALFTVAKDKQHPFIVHGVNYDTKVLGTVFKVAQSGNTFNVDLYEGKVSVNKATKPAETFVLRPKQTFTNFGIAEAATVLKTPAKSKAGAVMQSTTEPGPVTITFNECLIKNAIKVIEESYGVSVVYPQEYGDQKISITYYNASAMKLLETIALQLNLTTKNKNDTVYQLEK